MTEPALHAPRLYLDAERCALGPRAFWGGEPVPSLGCALDLCWWADGYGPSPAAADGSE